MGPGSTAHSRRAAAAGVLLLVAAAPASVAADADLAVPPRSVADLVRTLEAHQRDPASGKPLYRYAHPLFWAPFVVVVD